MSDLENCRLQLQNVLEQNLELRDLLQQSKDALQRIQLEQKTMMYYVLQMYEYQDRYKDQVYDNTEEMQRIMEAYGEDIEPHDYENARERIGKEIGMGHEYIPERPHVQEYTPEPPSSEAQEVWDLIQAGESDIVVYDEHIRDEGAEFIASVLKNNTTVTSLQLNLIQIEMAGAKALAHMLFTNTTITDIDLSDNRVGNDGASAFADALSSNKTVTSLNLSLNKITERGAYALSQMLLRNNTLQHLSLFNNNIGNRGCDDLLMSLSTNKGLLKLYLDKNQISEISYEAKQALQQNKTLIKLDLEHNPFNEYEKSWLSSNKRITY